MHYLKTISKVLLVGLIIGCSPQKRLHRLVKKHPELLQQDTIRVVDTVVVQNYSYDTTTVIRLHDTTTVIDNSRIVLKYFYDTITNNIIHEVECIGDTIISERFIPVERIIIKELTWWQKYGSIVIILSFLVLFLFLLKRFGKVLL